MQVKGVLKTMQRFMLKSKIHRATVTDADLHYEGSITIDEKLLEEANMALYEKVAIYDIDNGERFSTYIIKGKRNSGTICLNGAAARKVAKGDLIIIATYVLVDDQETKKWKPKCVLVDEKNKIKKVKLQV
jgi:aspartate 1-decarboxylase